MSGEGCGFELARDLGPATAREAHAALLGWMAARGEEGALELAPGEGAVSPLSLQLLVAASRSRAHPDLAFGPAAAAALDALSAAG